MTITKADLEGAECVSVSHYNMGRAGYGYGYRFTAYPRPMFINKTYRPAKEWPDGKRETEWYVDGKLLGIEADGLSAAIAALNAPVELTDEERAALAHVPPYHKPVKQVREAIAGMPWPQRSIYYKETPEAARALRLLDALRNKGLIEYSDDAEGHMLRRIVDVP